MVKTTLATIGVIVASNYSDPLPDEQVRSVEGDRMKIVKLSAAVLSLGLLVGCASEVPIPTAYERSYQPKMWAAHHWNVLAADVAERLNLSLSQLDVDRPLVLHVQRGDPTVFNYAFHELLETQLMQQGFGVTRAAREADLMVEYDVVSGGHADFEIESGFSRITPPGDDLLVNVSVTRGNRYITRISEIFYVDSTIHREFFVAPTPPPPPPTRLVDVVGS